MNNELKAIIAKYSDRYKITVEEYSTNLHEEYEWLFSFKGGGFNSVYSKTKAGAIRKAKAQYNGSIHTQVDVSSIRKATHTMSDAQNRAGWIMTM